MSSYSGYVLASPAPKTFSRTDIELPKSEVPSGPTLTYVGRAFYLSRWEEYTLASPIALTDEQESSQSNYTYPVFIARGAAKAIILAARKRIVEYAISQVLDRQIFPNLRKMTVQVDQMIEFCRSSQSEFLVTSLHGRFAGPSTNLRSISLYGDDVTQASVYDELHALFNFHSGGFGRRLFDGLPRLRPNEEGEIVRISNDGFVFLSVLNKHRARDLMRVIGFIVANGWVEDWVLGGNEPK